MVAWYFAGFQIAVVIGLIYLHVITLLLFNITEAHKEKLVQIVEHISKKDGHNVSKADLNSIHTAEDLIKVLTKQKR